MCPNRTTRHCHDVVHFLHVCACACVRARACARRNELDAGCWAHGHMGTWRHGTWRVVHRISRVVHGVWHLTGEVPAWYAMMDGWDGLGGLDSLVPIARAQYWARQRVMPKRGLNVVERCRAQQSYLSSLEAGSTKML